MRSRITILTAALSGLTMALAACETIPQHETAPALAARLADALARQQGFEAIPGAEAAQAEVYQIVRGMDGLHPTVDVTEVNERGDTATVRMRYAWALPAREWSYQTSADLVRTRGRWIVRWHPTALHPDLDATTRLVHRAEPARRARIVNARGDMLAGPLGVQRLGVSKPNVGTDDLGGCARAVARTLRIDEDRFVTKVNAAGSAAFVEGLVVRGRAKQDLPPGFNELRCASVVPDTRTLTAERGMAEEILGSVGEAEPEERQRDPALVAGTEVGRTGLQQRYDRQLRGRPGSRVSLARRDESPAEKRLLTEPGQPGRDLVISLDPRIQAKAEAAVEDVGSPAAIAVVRPSTGEILALANARESAGNSDANTGRYAPGSTFKIVSALALVRAGLRPDSMVNCQTNTTVDGRRFKNYSDFPKDKIGTMTLRESIAYSCNTGLIEQHAKITGVDLREAAYSLGVGRDYDVGFPAYFGQVPDPPNVVGMGESIIGQAAIQASSLAMAAVASSVKAGHTVVPHLVRGTAPAAQGRPLGAGESSDLRSMMEAVVSRGSATSLRTIAAGAKTGTAEYGTETPLRTHAWMIAYTDDVAVAAFVKDGDSGSATAAPLIREVLS